MRFSLFYPVCLGFIVGIFIASLYKISLYISFFILLLTIIYLGLSFYAGFTYSDKKLKQYSYIFITLTMLLSGSISMIRYHFFSLNNGDEIITQHIESDIEAEGIVIGESDEREKSVRYKVSLEKVNNEIVTPTKIIISMELYSDLEFGDRISIRGRLQLPENFETDSGRTFDYISFLKRDRIFYLMNKPMIEVIGTHEANKILEILFSIKQAFIKNLDNVIPFPESHLAAGLTVAGKKALPATVQEDFMQSGTMQVVVLSGYNVTIIAETFAALLANFSKLFASTTGIIGIILFTIMAGASATIVRGSVMAVLVLIAGLYGRQYNVNRSLMITAVIMLFLNPMLLVFDPSFQLSFLSTIGLIHFSPVCAPYFIWVTEKFQLRAATIATVSTQIFVTPFIIYQSGQVSSVAIAANLLVFLFIPLTMLLSFLAGMLTFVMTMIALPAAWIAFLFLKYELGVVHIFGQLPFALVQVPPLPVWLLWLIYTCFGVIIMRFSRRETPKSLNHTDMKIK